MGGLRLIGSVFGDHPAVNERLYQICRNVEGRSGRVIEAMDTGIREVRRSLREAGMAEPLIHRRMIAETEPINRNPPTSHLDSSGGIRHG